MKTKLTPADYYFQIDDDPDLCDGPQLFLTTKAYFYARGCLDDGERDEYNLLPPDYDNLMEATFGIHKSSAEVRKELTALGFTEKKMV